MKIRETVEETFQKKRHILRHQAVSVRLVEKLDMVDMVDMLDMVDMVDLVDMVDMVGMRRMTTSEIS